MTHYAADVLQGLELVREATKAVQAAIGIKKKNLTGLAALTTLAKARKVQVAAFGNYYPAGDEYELVYGITGKLIPPGGIPPHVGAVVQNVETLLNIARARQGIPVTEKFLTIAGCVQQPCSLRVPVGTRLGDLLQLAGGVTARQYRIVVGGLMMGALAVGEDQPVTKTTGGIIVLPEEHQVIQRLALPVQAMHRIGRSACDQCSYCTELCPRYLLGYDIQPHKVMRSLVFSSAGFDLWNQYGQLCCSCGLCTLYACPEMLFPREACNQAQQALQATGYQWKGQPPSVHPMNDARRVPTAKLIKRLGVERWDVPAGWRDDVPQPAEVELLLSQHIGAPATPSVHVGEAVAVGDVVAEITGGEADAVGARVHASIKGRVSDITDHSIIIQRN